MLIEHSDVEEDSCSALVALFHQLYMCVAAVSSAEGCVSITKAICKLLLQYQRGNRGAVPVLLPVAQEWLVRCMEGFRALYQPDSDQASRNTYRQLPVVVLPTLSTLATACALQHISPLKSTHNT